MSAITLDKQDDINSINNSALDQVDSSLSESDVFEENEESLLDQEKKRLEEEGRRAALQVNQVSESLEEKYYKSF